MKISIGLRVFLGLGAAWMSSVVVGFLFGCLYAVRLETGHIADFLKAAASGSKDAIGVSFFVGTTVAIAAAAIALLVTIFIAYPLYLASRTLERI